MLRTNKKYRFFLIFILLRNLIKANFDALLLNDEKCYSTKTTFILDLLSEVSSPFLVLLPVLSFSTDVESCS